MATANAIEKLDLKVGERHLIALTQLLGKPVASRFSGDQLMFTLVDGRKMFVDPYVQTVIQDAGIAPGEEFEIGKIENMIGNRRVVSVVARKMGQATGQRVPAPQGVAANSNVPHPTPPPAPPPLPPVLPTPVNGQGHTAAQIYLQCFAEAIDLTLAAVDMAKMKGLLISPAFEDVRCVATSLCIGRNR